MATTRIQTILRKARTETEVSLAAGTNVIGSILNVSSVSAVIPGIGSDNLGKASGNTHITGITGVMSLGVRKDTPAALEADGRFIPPIFDGTGKMWVNGVAKGETAADTAIANPPLTIGGRASAATPSAVSADGDVQNIWVTRNGAVVSAGGTSIDSALVNPPVTIGGRASATVPTLVNADGDVQNIWLTRAGAVMISTYDPLPVAVSTIPPVAIAKTGLPPAAPTAATVGVTSAQAVATNSARVGLVLTNTSSNTISIAFDNAAVLNSGITLPPNGGTFTMGEYTFCTGAVYAIASGASSNLAIQEFGISD